MSRFSPGLELSQALFFEAVQPILQRRFPGLRYAAARIGPGSDVLGFDDERSTDHFWGPLLTLFVSEADQQRWGDQIDAVLADELPFEIRGFPVNFRPFEGADARLGRHGHLELKTEHPLNHGVMLNELGDYFVRLLGQDPLLPMQPVDWLTLSEQHLRMLTAGRVFHDEPGELTRARATLAYYPRDVWLYLIATQWRRIEQEEAFMARCGEAGDELGSRLLAARLVRELMRLAFLLERTYAPYSKWFATAFAGLECGPRLGAHMRGALDAADWRSREAHLAPAYEHVAAMHNAFGMTERLPEAVSPHGRPYQIIHAARFYEATQAIIADEALRKLPPIGSVSQWADSTDVLERHTVRRRVGVVYG
jgi:hypothetical protein